MSTIVAIYKRFQKFDVAEAAVKSIDDTKEMLANINVEQMSQGQKSDGSFMPDYSERSVTEFGKPDGPIRLYDTGAFYQGYRVTVEGEKIVITSSDEKTDMLFKRYATKTSNLFGLNQQFRREYINEVLKKAFRKNVNAETGL